MLFTRAKTKIKKIIKRRLGISEPAVEHSYLGFFGRFASFAEIQGISQKYSDSNGHVDYSLRRAELIRKEDPRHLDFKSARLLAAIAKVALRESYGSNHLLKVLDFGGGFGNHYHQIRYKLDFKKLKWTVCETGDIVKKGRDILESGEIGFAEFKDLAPVDRFDLAICSCVLHYLPEPWAYLEKLFTKSSYVILDRLPLIPEAQDRLTLQNVGIEFYAGLHPWWFLSNTNFKNFLHSNQIETLLQWDLGEEVLGLDGQEVKLHGCLLYKAK